MTKVTLHFSTLKSKLTSDTNVYIVVKTKLFQKQNQFFIMEVGKRLVLLLAFFAGLFVRCLSEPNFLSGKIVPGVYVEEKAPLMSYEKAVPMVFEFKLKSELWNLNFLSAGRMRIMQRLACRSDNKTAIPSSTSDWSFTCPVFYHMYNYLRQFKVNYTDIHPTSRTLLKAIPAEKQFFSNPDIVFDECDSYLMRKWTGINGRDLGFEDYKSALESCNPTAFYVEDQIPDYSYDISPTFEQMRDNFISNFITNLSITNTAGEIVNNLIGLQGIQLFNSYAEITRFREAVLSCQKQLIPLSFIGATRLDKAMTIIRTQLLKSQYALAMPSISKLYKMPIADCIYGTSMLLVRILLPIEKKTPPFKLLKVHYPQFLYKTNTPNETHELCQIVPTEFSSSDSLPEFFLYDKTSNSLIPTECRPHNTKLCHIPDKGNRPLVNKCIFSVLHSSFEGIRRFCVLKCDSDILSLPDLKQITLPLIKRVNPSRFIVSLNRLTSILVKCDGVPDEMIMPQDFGAVEITLACNCYIAYHTEKFYPKYPCGNQLHLTHIIPDHMINSNLSNHDKSQEFFHIDINRIVNLTLRSKVTDSSQQSVNGQLKATVCEQHGKNQLILMWIFLVCQLITLSIVILFLYVKLYSLRKRLEYSRGAVCFSVSQMTSLNENDK